MTRKLIKSLIKKYKDMPYDINNIPLYVDTKIEYAKIISLLIKNGDRYKY